jgi:hypothetical protein
MEGARYVVSSLDVHGQPGQMGAEDSGAHLVAFEAVSVSSVMRL